MAYINKIQVGSTTYDIEAQQLTNINPIEKGGTNAATAGGARTNLGITYGTAVPTVAPTTGEGSVYFMQAADEPLAVADGGTGQTKVYTSFNCGRLNSSYNTITSQDCRYYPYLGLCTAHISITVAGYALAADTSFGLLQIPSAYAPTNMYGCTIYTSTRDCKGHILSKSHETQPRHIRLIVDKALSANYEYSFDVTAWWYL